MSLVQLYGQGRPLTPGGVQSWCLFTKRALGLLQVPIDQIVFTKYLLGQLEEMVSQLNLIPETQARFLHGYTVEDRCFLLRYMAEKYVRAGRGLLFLAFMDLKADFDTVNRANLWRKMLARGIFPTMVALVKNLHRNTWAAVRYRQSGAITKNTDMKAGVKHGFILGPLLFNIYISDMEHALAGMRVDPTSIHGVPIKVLIYVDNSVLMDRTERGLQRQLSALEDYSEENALIMNISKTTILPMGRVHKASDGRFRARSWK